MPFQRSDVSGDDDRNEFEKLPLTMLALWCVLGVVLLMVFADAFGVLDGRKSSRDVQFFFGVFTYAGCGMGCLISAQVMARMHHRTPWARSLVVPPIVISCLLISFVMFFVSSRAIELFRRIAFPSVSPLDDWLFWPTIGLTVGL